MHKSASGTELVCSKHQDFCRADSGLATGGSWGRRLACCLKVGMFLMKVGRRGSWQPGVCAFLQGCLCKRQTAWFWLPLTAHPAMLGTSKHARFTVSTASAHVLMAALACQNALRPCPERKCGSQNGTTLRSSKQSRVLGSAKILHRCTRLTYNSDIGVDPEPRNMDSFAAPPSEFFRRYGGKKSQQRLTECPIG